MTTKMKVMKFLKNDYQWVDLTWLIVFSVAAIATPFIMSASGIELQGGPRWITSPMGMTVFSIVSSIVGLFAAYLMLRKNKYAGLVGIAGEIMLGIIYYINGAFALGVVTMAIAPVISGYMWWNWHKAAKDGIHIEPKHMRAQQTVLMITVMTFLAVAIGSALVFTPGGDPTSYVSYLDSIMAVVYLAAMVMAALMYKEQYWIWIVMDVVSLVYIPLQIAGVGIDYQALYMIPTLVLTAGYAFTSVWGHFKWRKQ